MATYSMKYLEKIDLLTAQGKNSEEAKAFLDKHLESIGVTAGRYFYLEMFTNGEVGGAMVSAEVEPDTERGSGISRGKLVASDYVLIEATEEEYQKSAAGDDSIFKTKEYLKENNLKMKQFPVFERIEIDGKQMIRYYIAVKRR